MNVNYDREFVILPTLRGMGVGTDGGVSLEGWTPPNFKEAQHKTDNVVLFNACHQQTFVPSADGKACMRILGLGSKGSPGTPQSQMPYKQTMAEIQQHAKIPIEVKESCVPFTISKKTPMTGEEALENYRQAMRNIKVHQELQGVYREEHTFNVENKQTGVAEMKVDDAIAHSRKVHQEAAEAVADAAGGEEEGKECEDDDEVDDLDALEQQEAAPVSAAAAAASTASRLPRIPLDAKIEGQEFAVVIVVPDYEATLRRGEIVELHMRRRAENRSKAYARALAAGCEARGIPVPSRDDVRSEFIQTWVKENPNPLFDEWTNTRGRLMLKAAKWLQERNRRDACEIPEDFEVPTRPEGLELEAEDEDGKDEEWLRGEFLKVNPDMKADAAEMTLADFRRWWENSARRGASKLPEGFEDPDWEARDDLLSHEIGVKLLCGNLESIRKPTEEDHENIKDWYGWDERNPRPDEWEIAEDKQHLNSCVIWERNRDMQLDIQRWRTAKVDFPSEEEIMREWDAANPLPDESEMPQEEVGMVVLRTFRTEQMALDWVEENKNAYSSWDDFDVSVVTMYEMFYPTDSRSDKVTRKWRDAKQDKFLGASREEVVKKQELMAMARSQGKKVKTFDLAANTVQEVEDVPAGMTMEDFEKQAAEAEKRRKEIDAQEASRQTLQEEITLLEAEHAAEARKARREGLPAPPKSKRLVTLQRRLKENKFGGGGEEDDDELALESFAGLANRSGLGL